MEAYDLAQRAVAGAVDLFLSVQSLLSLHDVRTLCEFYLNFKKSQKAMGEMTKYLESK